jgi:hypothetical protein
MFTSCQQEADLTETAASIYTLYTIVDEKTSEESIDLVELALNRVLFYRLGVILKLEMVTEEEYDKLIEDKFAEMEAYELAKKNKDKNKKESSVASEEEVSQDIMTGDRILDILEEGGEIPLERPRLDIFLVRGYENYYNLATKGQLAALDEKLNNEAKSLRSSIHSTLFTAAKVGKKTYGVPVNNAIGEYTYLAFDAELLEKYKIDPNTLKSLEDLQDYLELIKENEPDVTPLKSAKVSTEINFLANEGFPALIASNGTVVDAYKNPAFKNYFAMVARYKALGYIADQVATEEDDNARYAVRIETGTIDSIEKSLESTGREYDFSLFSAPLATNETTIDNIFCVSKYVVANELTEVMKIVTALNTDPQLMNILTYGVENENYRLNDDGQVVRLEEKPYYIDPNHAGNCFITHTLAGENPDKWNNAIKQNQDAIVSPSLGFTSDPTAFKYKETVTVEDPKKPGEMIEQEVEHVIYEPDYINVLNTVVDKYYPALLAGTAIEFDYTELLNQATIEITEEFTERNNDLFEANVLKPMFAERMREEITKKQGPKIYKEIEEEIRYDYFSSVKKSLKNKLTSQMKNEHPDASSSEITEMVNEILTEDYVNEHFNDYYTEEEVQEMIDEMYHEELEYEIEMAIDEIVDTDEYAREFEKIKKSDEYLSKLESLLKFDAPSKITARVDEFIASALTAYTDAIIDEMEAEIEAAVAAFITENAETLGLTETEIYVQIGYYKEDKSNEEAEGDAPAEEGEESEEPDKVYIPAYDSWFEFVFTEKLQDTYYDIYPLPTT